MTAQNDITKDRIANVKGDKNRYDAGWDAIFGKKCDNGSTTDQPDQEAGGQDGESKR